MDLATVDKLLTTTRAVRKRLDLNRPVPDAVILECLRLAIQAPTGSNAQLWRWIVVTDRDVRAGLARLYRYAAARCSPEPPTGSRNGIGTVSECAPPRGAGFGHRVH